LLGGAPDGANVVAARFDGDGVFGDVTGDGTPGIGPAEGNLDFHLLADSSSSG